MSKQPANTQLVPYEMWNVRQVVDRLLSSTTPVHTILELVRFSASPNSSAFERYAGSVLRDAGAASLSDLPANATILLAPPRDARLARLTCTAKLDESKRQLVMNVENAVNRLCCIADSLEDSSQPRPLGPTAIAISRLGGGFIADRAGFHSANVKLPEIGRSEQPDMSYFNEVDWRVLDHIASTAHPIFQSSVLPNMYQAFMGAYGPDGSDWDVRTRLAGILEKLELPISFHYRFDVSVPDHAVAIAFTVPTTEAFPRCFTDPLTGKLCELGQRAHEAQTGFAIRLASLLAAAAFGSGRKVELARITGVRQSDSRPILTCAFSRKQYVYHALTAIDAGELSNPSIRFNASAIALAIDPDEIEWVRFDSNEQVNGHFERALSTRIAPHLDHRALPDDIRRLFHAQRISDIDTSHYHGPGAQELASAREDAGESTLSAIARLERIASELEADIAQPDSDADTRPLYCSNPLARAVVSLLDDHLAVSAQAEAFLHGEDAERVSHEHRPAYFRAPDALFHAHMGLSDLYEQLGDISGSEAQADRCIALAPTTAAAYFRKADVLAEQSRYHEAANVLSEGLLYAVSPRDCALLYYHLALILWNTGRKREAVAVHVYTASLEGPYATKAQRVVANLRKRNESPVIVYASPLAAAREMARARIPIAPSDSARTLIVKAAVGLSCANAPKACAPYAATLAAYFRDDPIIASTCCSIIHGATFE